MKISVKNILDSLPGNSDKHEVVFPHRFVENFLGDGIVVLEDIHTVFEAMKVPEGVMGKFLDVETEITRLCDGCDKVMKEKITDLNTGWRHFVWKKDEEYVGEELEDVFLIDKTEGSVQLDECLRQELVIALPPFVLCEACLEKGAQLDVGGSEEHPFQNLKKLLEE